MNNIETIIKNALESNGYPDTLAVSPEEMASIILFELQDGGILTDSEEE